MKIEQPAPSLINAAVNPADLTILRRGLDPEATDDDVTRWALHEGVKAIRRMADAEELASSHSNAATLTDALRCILMMREMGDDADHMLAVAREIIRIVGQSRFEGDDLTLVV